MSLRSVANIIQRGGTIIKTDRCKAFMQKEVRAEAANILRRKKIDALVVILAAGVGQPMAAPAAVLPGGGREVQLGHAADDQKAARPPGR